MLVCSRSVNLDFGGPAQTVPRLALSLAQRGVRVGLAVAKYDGAERNESVQELRHRGGKIVLGCAGKRSDVASLFGEQLPEIIHDNGVWRGMNHKLSVAGKQLSIPRVVTPRGMLEPWSMAQKRWKKKLAWHLYQRVDLETASAIHATAVAEAESVVELGIRAPIAVIPNGVEIPQEGALNGMKWEKTEKMALFLSRIHPKKGLLDLIRAWRRVSPLGWKLVIAGPDEVGYERVVRKEVKEYGLERNVLFAGPVYGEDKDSLLKRAWLCLLPTYSENFGVFVAEGLAWGVPVITTKGAPWGVLERECCGWWAEIGEAGVAEALSDAVGKSGCELSEMGKRGRELAMREYGWEGVAREVSKVYDWLLGSGPRPGCVVG